jgi:hypothetical protein
LEVVSAGLAITGSGLLLQEAVTTTIEKMHIILRIVLKSVVVKLSNMLLLK